MRPRRGRSSCPSTSIFPQPAALDRAFAFTTAIVDYCESFGRYPRRGTRRDDIRPGLRTIGFRKRVTIAFVVGAKVVTIVGVFYAGQNIETTFHKQ